MYNIAFFVGSDITSHLVLQDLLKKIISTNILVKVFFPTHLNKNTDVPKEIALLSKYERGILNDVVYKFLEQNEIYSFNSYNTPSYFDSVYNTEYEIVPDINAQSFKDKIIDNFDGVVSIRCYHKFDAQYIAEFSKSGKFIWNLHPGDLPKYRGVMTCVRAMYNRDSQHTYTLHEMNTSWDAGPIINKLPIPLDYNISVLSNMCKLYKTGGDILFQSINDVINNKLNMAITQTQPNYFSFPTREELREYRNNGIEFIDHNYMVDFYVNNFLEEHSHHRETLRNNILEYLEAC